MTTRNNQSTGSAAPPTPTFSCPSKSRTLPPAAFTLVNECWFHQRSWRDEQHGFSSTCINYMQLNQLNQHSGTPHFLVQRLILQRTRQGLGMSLRSKWDKKWQSLMLPSIMAFIQWLVSFGPVSQVHRSYNLSLTARNQAWFCLVSWQMGRSFTLLAM